MIIQQIKKFRSNWFQGGFSKITNVLCSDGKYRTFFQTADNDTFFTTPGYVHVNGKAVRGHLFHDNMIWDDSYPKGLWKFTGYTYLKNGHLLPEWKKECTGCHLDIERGEEIHTFSYYYWHESCLDAHNMEMGY